MHLQLVVWVLHGAILIPKDASGKSFWDEVTTESSCCIHKYPQILHLLTNISGGLKGMQSYPSIFLEGGGEDHTSEMPSVESAYSTTVCILCNSWIVSVYPH